MNYGFWEWWSRINRLLFRILVFLFAMFAISQASLMSQTIKTYISMTDKLEGRSIAESRLFIQKGEIEITADNLSSLSPLVFYINGEKTGFASGKSIKLQVKENDVVEVSGAGCSETAVLKVTGVSGEIAVPEPGKLIYVNNNLVMIDRVRLRQ